MESNINQLSNASKAIFIAIENHWDNPEVSLSFCSNQKAGYFQENFSVETNNFQDERKRLSRILSDSRIIVTDSEETKEFLIKQFQLPNCAFIPIFSIAYEVLPAFIFKLYAPQTVKDLFYLFFCESSFETNKVKECRIQMEHTTNDLLFYKSFSGSFSILHKKCDLLEQLAEEIKYPDRFATINLFKDNKNTYDEKSFIGTRFLDNKYSFEVRKYFDSDELFFKKLSEIFSDVKYVLTYDGNTESTYLKNLYRKFKADCNFEIIDLKDVTDMIFRQAPQCLDVLFQRFLLGYDYDYDFRYVDQSTDLLTLLLHMIEEYKEATKDLTE